MNNKTINVFISGDFAPRKCVSEVIEQGKYQMLFNEILPIIKDSDIAITNLEIPLFEGGKPLAKTGPNLKAPIKSIEALKFGGFDMVTLANNHMMDFGKEGLLSTIRVCEDNNIRHIGAGFNNDEAKKIEYYNIKQKRIAFINCCENEWSTTHGNYPGCNPLNEVALFYQIQEAQANADYVILIIHGGHETYEYPSPRMKKLYRWFVDLGVDAVIGHHTHCFSGYEFYKNKPIIYSLGNFVFDNKNRESSWYQGAAAKLMITDDDIKLKLYPFNQCENEIGVHLFTEEESKKWFEKEQFKTLQIQDDAFLEQKFEEFILQFEKLYRSYLEPNKSSWILAAKNRGLLPRAIQGHKRLLFLNLIRAEAHRDIVLHLLSCN